MQSGRTCRCDALRAPEPHPVQRDVAAQCADHRATGRPARVASRRSAAPGFTLLEILLAVVIFGIVLAAINTVFYAALRLRNKTTQRLEHSLPLQHAVQTLKQDIGNLVAPGGTLAGDLQTTPTERSIGVPWERVSPEFFTTTAFIDPTSPWSEIQKVTYYLAASTNPAPMTLRRPGRDLMRVTTRNLLPATTAEASAQRLLTGVEGVVFSYYDGSQWLGYWDSTVEETPLPTAIKVQIQLEQPTNTLARSAPVEIVVPISVVARTNETTTTDGGQA